MTTDFTKPLTVAALDELAKLEEAASDGTWQVYEPDDNGQPVIGDKDIERATFWHHSVGALETEAHANAEFTVAARNAFKQLLELARAALLA